MSTPAATAERALVLARAAGRALDEGRARDAGWLALRALELDPGDGLAWAVVSHLILAASDDPLGTLAGRHALALGVPAAERPVVERHHRIDLWRRGLVTTAEGASILPVGAFGDGARFASDPGADAWYAAQLQPFDGSAARAVVAAQRMVAAISSAWAVPTTGDENPLHAAAPWPETEAYARWRAWLDEAALAAQEADAGPWRGTNPYGARHEHTLDADASVVVLSDHWIEVEIATQLREAQVEAAVARATLWSTLRPEQLRPRAALLRAQHAAGRVAEADATARAILAARARDLNDLEEARVALGELRRWPDMLALLDQMEALVPGHPVLLTHRGVALLELGRRDEGAALLERAVELDPANGPALANLGLERMRHGEYVAARTLLERAVERAPDQPEARLYLAVCKNNQGDRRGALADLDRVLALAPDHARARQLKAELESHALRPR